MPERAAKAAQTSDTARIEQSVVSSPTDVSKAIADNKLAITAGAAQTVDSQFGVCTIDGLAEGGNGVGKDNLLATSSQPTAGDSTLNTGLVPTAADSTITTGAITS